MALAEERDPADDPDMARCGVWYRYHHEESRGPRGGHVVHYRCECVACGRKSPLVRITSDSMGKETTLRLLREGECPTPILHSAHAVLLQEIAGFIEKGEPLPLAFAVAHFSDRSPAEAIQAAWDECVEGHALGTFLHAFSEKQRYESRPRYSEDRARTMVSFFCAGVTYDLRGNDADVAKAIRGIVDGETLVAGAVRRLFAP